MKKVILLFITTYIVLLSSCACKHNWLPATCNMPIICEKCGEISGSPNLTNHRWSITNCTTKSICEICNAEGDFGNHYWIAATYERAKYCSICGTEDGLPLLDSSDIRYVLAACAYREIYNLADLPSTIKIERVRYSYATDTMPYITVILDCSAENTLGGRALIRCYSYNVQGTRDYATSVLPPSGYSTFTWPYNDAKIYCRIEDSFEIEEDPAFFKWDELTPDLVIQRYKELFK